MAHRIPEPVAPEPVLRVLPRGTALVQDYRALHETGTNRFHGWQFDGTLGPEFRDNLTGQMTRHGGRVKQTDAVVEVSPSDPWRGEYVRHVQQGDLWAADPETAAACGVAFEPHFAGEHPAASARHGLAGAALTARLRSHGFPAGSGAAAVPWDTDFKPKVPTADEILAKQAAPSATLPLTGK
jgi:hypothetical protein